MVNKKEVKPGVIYTVSEPEFLGKFPIRTEIEVLPADDPNRPTIGCKVEELDGGEVYKLDQENQVLNNLEDIKVGDEVLVPTLIGTILMKISEIKGNKAQAETENSVALLNFGTDSRKCWTSNCLINKKILSGKYALSIKSDK